MDEADRVWLIEELRKVCQEHLHEDMDNMFVRLADSDSKAVRIKF